MEPSSIKPIYKKADKNNPSNYRSITLLNVMGKIFSSIVPKTVDRILDSAEANGILNDSQFGFRENRRTTDAVFICIPSHIYQELMNRHCEKEQLTSVHQLDI